ncbi:efflux RND transporter periplasmic adaptor subunit [Flavisolibacter ginsenosidimutans]|uniref:HlyD family efflux transporter periplasmic adaptor subunit n=1 Tax=Flavisolibacter ginsenosidimutans TaxID=661481 RepID=A0A5B8UGN2_9BACT|nr:HlyD family efflux transporter periplasmic adaptor subunit [Flavisolibacter ginsenosidimutans]QEC55797.1 HlyD family efflux transporter periplasmic adaptor subunit [Flavisolibacter ginsenosidimutans]
MKQFCLLLLLIAFFSCKQKVELTKAETQNITESVYASGRIKSRGQYEVFATVSGIVAQMRVKEGDQVRKGDVLFTLVNEAPQLSQENAAITARYQSVQANLDKLNEAQANIDLARTKLQNDSLLLARQRNLWASEIGSRNELEQRELAAKNSRLAYQTALLRYKQLQQQLTFSEQQSKKSLQISSTVSGDYTVRAKQDGKVYNVTKEAGEAVNPQTPVAVIGSGNDFILELQVDEYDVAKIALGQKVLVTMDSYKGQVFEATVTKIDPYLNERSRSATIEAAFTKGPPNLFPNLTAEANVLLRVKEGALTIPRSYLVDETYVLLQNGEKKKITTGVKDYQRVEVLSGLNKDDVIQKPHD